MDWFPCDMDLRHERVKNKMHGNLRDSFSGAFRILTLSCIMLKNGETHFENLALFTSEVFLSMFGCFSILCIKRFM